MTLNVMFVCFSPAACCSRPEGNPHAIATRLRVGSPVATHLLFAVYLGAMMWGGLVLRDRRLRELLLPG